MVNVPSMENIKKIKGDIQQVKTSQRASQKREREQGSILIRIEKKLNSIAKGLSIKW